MMSLKNFKRRKALSRGLKALFVVGLFAGLAACQSVPNYEGQQAQRPAPTAPIKPPPQVVSVERDPSQFLRPRFMAGASPVRVALLLPFNSSRSNVRQVSSALYNAAQLALFEFGNSNLLLIPKDTGDSAETAANAARSAIGEGAELILGPLFAEQVSAVAPVAYSARVPVVAFSTDVTVAGNGVHLLSFPPEQDVNRIVDYAGLRGIKNFAALIPQGDYGNRVRAAFEQATRDRNLRVTAIETYPAQSQGMYDPVKRIAGGAAQQDMTQPGTVARELPFQALFVPEGGNQLRVLAPLLPYYNIDTTRVKLLGTGLWDDPSIASENVLQGGWYPAPPVERYGQFVERYKANYKTTPPRIASLAYDGVSLAAALANRPAGNRYTEANLTSTDGFAGVDGAFRFLPNGQTERGLAVMELRSSGPITLDPARSRFTSPPAF